MAGPQTVQLDAPQSQAYRQIQEFYGGRCAERSGVPLLQHIDEGFWLLDQLQASGDARAAYCLHPLFQADADLLHCAGQPELLRAIPRRVLLLCLEYRHIANRSLAHGELAGPESIVLSPLAEVNDMLRADKLQNRKDFEKHHRGTHPGSARLARYFGLWLARLGIDEARYQALRAGLEEGVVVELMAPYRLPR